VRRKLGGAGSLLEPFPRRPKGMKRKTWWRHFAKATHSWLEAPIPLTGDCWDRVARWPDGKPLDQWDALANEAPPGSVNERDQWRDTVRERLRACEDAKPLAAQLRDWVSAATPLRHLRL